MAASKRTDFPQDAFGHLGELDMANDHAGAADRSHGGVRLDAGALHQRLERPGNSRLVQNDPLADSLSGRRPRRRL